MSKDKLKYRIAGVPFLGRILLFFYRAALALGYFRRPFGELARWLFRSRETTNFTYDLEGSNIKYLASMIADVAGIEVDKAAGYIREIEEDDGLKRHIAEATEKSDLSFIADRQVRFGRRIGWYAFARALKPSVVVETGVDKGLGACVLTAALKKNAEEGAEGRYFGTDIDHGAGYLLTGEYARYGEVLYGDSIESLSGFSEKIDLFVNDSDHSAEYEAGEYRAIEGKLSERAVVLGDNAHVTDMLLEFSLRTKRHFVYFHEKPRDHWYPGSGIGISFRR